MKYYEVVENTSPAEELEPVLDILNEFGIELSDLDNFMQEMTTGKFQIEELMTEAQVPTTKKTIRENIATTAKNTIDSTRKAVKAYSDTTDAGGTLIKSIYDLTMAVINLFNRILGFLVSKAVIIPNLLSKLFQALNDLPENISTKLHGDFQLYVTPDDFALFHTFQKDFTIFMELGDIFVSGDSFTSHSGTIGRLADRIVPISSKDTALLTKMEVIYNKYKNTDFVKTRIPITGKATVETYLDKDSDYYKNVMNLHKWISDQEKSLKRLKNDLQKKFDTAKSNLSLKNMVPSDQIRIKNSIQMIGFMVNLVGRFGGFVMSDLKTITANIEAINRKITEAKKKEEKTSEKK